VSESGFRLLRAQKNRWAYRISTGFSPLPAAGQNLLQKIALFCDLLGVVGGISALCKVRTPEKAPKK
jgi:hypothetical protein